MGTLETQVHNLITKINTIILEPIGWFLVAGAIIVFIYGLLNFFLSAEDDSKRAESKTHMLYGIIGLVIMFGVWGIIGIISNTIG